MRLPIVPDASLINLNVPEVPTARSCSFGFGEERLDLVAGCDDVAEAELAALRRPARDACVLGKLAARVEREDLSALQVDHGDRAGRPGGIAP